MLGPPVDPPLLARKSRAVTTRAVRKISRKGLNDARSQVGAERSRALPGRLCGRRGQLQCVLSPAGRLSDAVEGFPLLQYLAAGRGDPLEIQEASRLRNDAAEARRCLVLRGEQPHGHYPKCHTVFRSLQVSLSQEAARLRQIQEARRAPGGGAPRWSGRDRGSSQDPIGHE